MPRPMDERLAGLLHSLLMNVDVINDEMTRMMRSEQFTADPACIALLNRCGNTLSRALETVQEAGRRIS